MKKVILNPIHIDCPKEDIADIVIMPGDPLRAKYVADNFLDDARLVTSVRNMFGYTGFYKGRKLTVMGSGMGIPSMGIYAYELYHFYDVENIIRIGSCGNPLDPETNLMDIVIADSSYSKSNFAYQFNRSEGHFVEGFPEVTNKLCQTADKMGIKYRKGTIMTTEVFDFYIVDLDRYLETLPKEYNIVAAEMECYALFHTAKHFNKKAGCVATVVDSKFTTESMSIEEREKSLTEMITLALESIL